MSLDDLLHAASEHRATPDPGEISVRVVLRILAISAVAAFAAYQLLLLVGYRVPYLLLLGVPTAGLLARRITARTHGPPPPKERRPAAEDRPQDTAYQGARRWVSRLAGDAYDRDDFSQRTYPMIVTMVDERLRLRHGIERRRDPQRARAVMPEELWRFVTQPPRRRPRPAQLTLLARQIKNL